MFDELYGFELMVLYDYDYSWNFALLKQNVKLKDLASTELNLRFRNEWFTTT